LAGALPGPAWPDVPRYRGEASNALFSRSGPARWLFVANRGRPAGAARRPAVAHGLGPRKTGCRRPGREARDAAGPHVGSPSSKPVRWSPVRAWGQVPVRCAQPLEVPSYRPPGPRSSMKRRVPIPLPPGGELANGKWRRLAAVFCSGGVSPRRRLRAVAPNRLLPRRPLLLSTDGSDRGPGGSTPRAGGSVPCDGAGSGAPSIAGGDPLQIEEALAAPEGVDGHAVLIVRVRP